ncbi:Alpha-ketoglutarate-dependent dioxygenase alkB 6 [Dinochytrium kinnereticum]|nr:Alpha-ketoglutarate-dependent dioxygenase alkB 6 [Dinochytrium kinnereticum]
MLALTKIERFRVQRAPNSIHYVPDFISEEEEARLIRNVNSAPLPKWTVLRNRRLQNWGCTPCGKKGIAIHENLPAWLEEQAIKISDMGAFDGLSDAGTSSEGNFQEMLRSSRKVKPNHVLVNEYRPGQGIMPHEDGPAYLPTVATISLGQHTILDFYKSEDDDADKVPQELENRERAYIGSLFVKPRSLLVLREDAYVKHLHGIEERTVDELSYTNVLNWDEAGILEDRRNNITSERRETRISLTYRCAKRVTKINLMGGLQMKNSF